MTEAQPLLDKIRRLLDQPVEQWADKQMGKQLRQELQQCFDRAAELVGDQDPQLRSLRARREEVQSKVNSYQVLQSGGSADTSPLPDAAERSIRPDGVPAQPTLLDPRRGTTPWVVEQSASSASALYEPGPFGEAVVVFRRQQQRFELQHKLQTGLFSTGFAALDHQTSEQVVIKFPAQDSWFTRFDECVTALHNEAHYLQAIHAQLAESAGQTIARPVVPLDEGVLQVESALQEVPWFAQSFARGHRLSTPGMLPMRDAQEHTALQILAQLTGLIQELYRHGWAHRDLKVDCLFWDSASQTLEVIDWNRAAQMPSEEDRDLEFAALQRLVSSVLMGPLFEWSKSDQLAHDLFIAFRGMSLSRGARLLLLRLLSPTMPVALGTISDLHGALTELLGFWNTPLTEQPDWANMQPPARSALLSRLAIELQRPAETSLIAAQRRDWYRQGLTAVQQTVRGALGVWITVHETMRAEFNGIEQLWMWFPDIWPLTWVVPLSRAWFSDMPRSSDRDLAKLVEVMLNRRWDAVIQMIQSFPSLSPGVRQQFDAIRRISVAYQDLERIERMFNEPSPDYSGAMSRLVAIRDLLPQEWLVSDLLVRIDSGIQGVAQLNRLLGAVSDLQQQDPTQDRQRRLWALYQELQRLGLDDPRYAQQEQLITHLAEAQQAYNQAQQMLEAGSWTEASVAVASWLDDATLRQSAPDLHTAFVLLKQQATDHATREQLSSWDQQIRHALVAGQLNEASRIAEQAATVQASAAPELAGFIQLLVAALSRLQASWLELQRENYVAAQQALPAQLPATLQALGTEFDALVSCGLRLEQAKTFSQLLAVYQMLDDQRRQAEFATITWPLWTKLRNRVISRLELSLITELSQSAVVGEQLAVYEAGLDYLYKETSAPLRRAADLLKQRQAQGRQEQASRALHPDLQQLNQQQSELIQTVAAIQEQSRQVHTQMYALDQALVQRLDGVLMTLNQVREDQLPMLQWVQQQVERSERPGLLARSRQRLRSFSAGLQRPRSSQPARVSLWHWLVLGGGAIVTLGLAWILVNGMPRVLNAGAVAVVVPSPTVTATRVVEPTLSASVVAVPSATNTPRIVNTSTPLPPSVPLQALVTANPTSLTVLPGTVLLQGAGIGEVASVEAIVGESILTLSTQPMSVTDQVQITLPANLLKGVPNFALPQNIKLQPVGDFQSVTVSLPTLEVAIQGLATVDPALNNELHKDGAYLWKDPDSAKRALPGDAVKPVGTPDTTGDYVLLNQDDRVKILRASGDLYQIETVTNAANNNASTVINQTGWVRRVFVDGNP